MRWVKSSYSAASDCLEWCVPASDVLIRDSRLGDGSPVLRFTPASWRRFTAGIREEGKRWQVTATVSPG